ncbi:hypothetical protein WG66_011412 [Moniliophthora roreri]|nr:hypothetical protein WG66_011412 [Moniliophthora roreri]
MTIVLIILPCDGWPTISFVWCSEDIEFSSVMKLKAGEQRMVARRVTLLVIVASFMRGLPPTIMHLPCTFFHIVSGEALGSHSDPCGGIVIRILALGRITQFHSQYRKSEQELLRWEVKLSPSFHRIPPPHS